MPDLYLRVKGEYFVQVLKGLKPEEYRLVNDHWTKHLVGREYNEIVYALGYPAKEQKDLFLRFPYRGYTIKTITHKHFGPEPVEVFAIPLNPHEREER